MASVEITRLKKLYGDVVALSDINLNIESGSFFTLLGPSGCGKTTLLRTIAGFHFQNAGTIKIDGKSIENAPAHKRDVGMVFQDYAVFPHLSVADNVAFGLKQRKVSAADLKTRVAQVLDAVQLTSFADRMPHELSGGQQQRVGLARAIVINPTVLLMDEPLSNLDAKLRVDLRAELRRIQQDLGMTTVYVTHDQEEALAMSDVVCVLHDGIIQQAASPLDIYNQPANKFVASFVGGNNFLQAKAIGGKAQLACAAADLGPVRDTREGIVAAVRPENIQVHLPGDQIDAACVAVPGIIEQISFIGREMEVHGRTETGEVLKVVSRPDVRILDQSAGAPAQFVFSRDDVILFEDTPNGGRLS
ncbi:MAG TPA: ABC transporter ATP-binding protein [Aliiroseovarius sp.]|nr:ABC transporter ATP-binding protein [Aliiroseovarius sp.]